MTLEDEANYFGDDVNDVDLVMLEEEMPSMKPLESTTTTKALESTESADSTESRESAESTESRESTEFTESTKSIESVESTESMESTESTESIESMESTESTKSSVEITNFSIWTITQDHESNEVDYDDDHEIHEFIEEEGLNAYDDEPDVATILPDEDSEIITMENATPSLGNFATWFLFTFCILVRHSADIQKVNKNHVAEFDHLF